MAEYFGKVRFLKMDIEENPNYAASHDLFSVPTTMFFKNGKLIRFKSRVSDGRVDRLTGVRTAKVIKDILNYLLSLN